MELRPLKRRQNVNTAQKLLERIYSDVQPIMKLHNFRVGSLQEFYPTNPNLLGLNVNHGQVIRIRLRHAFDDNQFLEFHDLIGTMLHELAHNVHGPHDAKFYKFLDRLFDNYERSQDAGFRSNGNRLGGRHVTEDQFKKESIAAAEKRRKLNTMMIPVGGRKLGTRSELDNIMTPAQLAAMAAERRAQDSKWCGIGSDECDHSQKDMEHDHSCPIGDAADPILTQFKENDPLLEMSNIAGSMKRSSQASFTSNTCIPACQSQSPPASMLTSADNQVVIASSSVPAFANESVMASSSSLTRAQSIDQTEHPTVSKIKTDLTAESLSMNSYDGSSYSQPIIIEDIVEASWQTDVVDSSKTWICLTCTLINKSPVLQCECCLAIRSK
ncbi:hypothetical protein O5D80_000945 [Batrachochytrium dendrobatidis]|nr:hypothetical protein O5D80_000945 [Batrachochytrium dendrobatidis]